MPAGDEAAEVVELRVHGVGGTRPESILDDPHLRRVSGDDLVGFYRPARDDSGHVREALSWGRITAGDATRALWVLLLPFALANLSGWTHPPAAGAAGALERTGERLVKRMARLFGLSITVGAVLMAANFLLDLVAYQCGAAPQCRGPRWWMAPFRWSVVADRAGLRLAAGALMCFGFIAVLAWAGRSSYKNLEEYDPAAHGEEGAGEHPASVDLSHPDFWRGSGPVGQLRDLHFGAALATLAMVVALSRRWLETALQQESGYLISVAEGQGGSLPGSPAALAIAAASGAVLIAIALTLVFNDGIYRRPHSPEPRRFRAVKIGGYLLFLAALGNVAGFQIDVSGGRLESLDGPNLGFFAFQGLFLTGLLACLMAARNRKEVREAPFHGVGAFALSAIALFVLSSSWAGGVIRIADLLGTPALDGYLGGARTCRAAAAVPPEGAGAPVLCYAQYHQKTAAVALVVFAALILVAIRVALWTRRQAAACEPEVTADLERSGWRPPEAIPPDTAARIRKVAGSYSSSTLVGNADSLLLRAVALGSATALVQHLAVTEAWVPRIRPLVDSLSTLPWRLAGLGVLVAAVFLPVGSQPSACGDSRRGGSATTRQLLALTVLAVLQAVLSLSLVRHQAVATAASWAVTLLPVAVVAGLYGALRNPNLRRSIGMIWDVVTFWPRHYHPFAPPCYGERLVPQLKYRLKRLVSSGGRVLLSAHSQGSVVAAAALLQAGGETCRRVALFTYGSPLEILYRRFFPAYFGGGVLESIDDKLRPGNIRYPWQHFYCRTDPLGVPMTAIKDDGPGDRPVETPAQMALAEPVPLPNTQLLDPHTWEAVEGEPPWPMRRHSAYLEHPTFLKLVDFAVEEMRAGNDD